MTASSTSPRNSAELSPDGSSLTVTLPLVIRRQGGRKRIIVPPGQPGLAPPRREFDKTLVKALARAFRWNRMLESGRFATVAELAEREGIAAPYLTRILRLALLAPDLVEALLEGSQPTGLKLEALRTPLPMAWTDQRAVLNALLD